MNRKKIGFTGPFADINFGDYAMVVNNIYDFDVEDVVLYSYNSHFLQTIKSDYLNDFNVDIVEVQLKDDFKVASEDRILTPIDILHNLSNYNELVSSIKEIDVLIVNGGGYINSLWSMPHRINKLIKIFAPILLANQFNKKIIFTGNGYGPFTGDFEFFGCILNSLDNVVFGARDNLYSPMWVGQIGMARSVLEFIPDDLFIVNDKLIKRKPRTKIALEKYIVMETYLPLGYLQENIDSFKEFSRDIHIKYGLNILFLPFNLKQGGMDQAIYLDSKLENFKYYDIRTIGYLPIEDTIELIKNAELVISSRYHALVMALSVRTPVVSVLRDVLGDKRYYYNKNYGMLKQVLNGNEFDERDYLRLDYLEALNFVSRHFEKIINVQSQNYNETYKRNVEFLNSERNSFILNYISEATLK